jgi:hypothetical protein
LRRKKERQKEREKQLINKRSNNQQQIHANTHIHTKQPNIYIYISTGTCIDKREPCEERDEKIAELQSHESFQITFILQGRECVTAGQKRANCSGSG